MTLEQAYKIKEKVENINQYSPLTLRIQLNDRTEISRENSYSVAITYNYTPDEWMCFTSWCFNYDHINDKLSGFQFAIEAFKAYQEEHGNLKFSHSE